MRRKHSVTKKLLFLAMVFCVVVSQVWPVYSAADDGFTDVKKGAWYYNDVMSAKKAGLVKGIGNGLYAPETEVTYGQFITALVRIFKSDDEITGASSEDPQSEGLSVATGGMPGTEPEVTGKHWSDKYILAARELEIVGWRENIRPDVPIPREEMIRYMVNALGLELSESEEMAFADVPPQYKAYTNTAYEEYLTEGIGRNKAGMKLFGYSYRTTRAEMAAILNRVVAYKDDPEAYKAEKARLRAKADAGYSNELKYITYNGYRIPASYADMLVHRPDFDFYAEVRLFEGWMEDWGIARKYQYDVLQVMKSVLESKLDSSAVQEAIEYVYRYDGPKTFKAGKYYITVRTHFGDYIFNVTEYKGPGELDPGYTIYNGFIVPKENRFLYTTDSGELEFYGWVIYETRPYNFDVIEAILSSKLDPTVVKQAVDYGRTKVFDVNLPIKRFQAGDYSIMVMSAPRSDRVDFQVSYEPEWAE